MTKRLGVVVIWSDGQQLVPLIASVVVGGWITLLAVNEEWRTFYPIVDGAPDASAPGQVADLGIEVTSRGPVWSRRSRGR